MPCLKRLTFLDLGDNLDADRAHTPLQGGSSGGHPDINTTRAPLRVHAVGDREHFIAVVGRDSDFRTEGNAVHSDNTVSDFLARGGGKWITIALVNGRGVGASPDRHGFSNDDWLIGRSRECCQGAGVFCRLVLDDDCVAISSTVRRRNDLRLCRDRNKNVQNQGGGHNDEVATQALQLLATVHWPMVNGKSVENSAQLDNYGGRLPGRVNRIQCTLETLGVPGVTGYQEIAILSTL